MAAHFVIGIDFDDVLVATADKVTDIYNTQYGTTLTRDNWYNYDPIEPWGTSDMGELVKRVIGALAAEEFRTVEAIDGAVQVLQDLQGRGHEMVVVTGRPESSRLATRALLDTLYPGIFPTDALHFTDHYSHDGQRMTKVEVVENLGITHFVDDRVDHLVPIAEAGIKSLLFSDHYAWNQGKLPQGIARFTSWKQIGEFFDRESAE